MSVTEDRGSRPFANEKKMKTIKPDPSELDESVCSSTESYIVLQMYKNLYLFLCFDVNYRFCWFSSMATFLL